MSSQGYIYVLINPAMPGLLKIGLTTKTPEERVKELSGATGVPINFILIYKEFFQNCAAAEKAIHAHLEAQGYRFNKGREFFEAEPSDVVDIIKDIKAIEKELECDDADSSELEDSEQQPWKYYQDLADNYYYGLGDKLQDYTEAYINYLKAFELMSPTAPKILGDILQNGEGVKANSNDALKYYKAGVERGDNSCWFYIAMYYHEMGHGGNFVKSIRNLLKTYSIENELHVLRLFVIMNSMYNEYISEIITNDDVCDIYEMINFFKTDIVCYLQNLEELKTLASFISTLINMCSVAGKNEDILSYSQICMKRFCAAEQIKRDFISWESLGMVMDLFSLLINKQAVTVKSISPLLLIFGDQIYDLINYCDKSIIFLNQTVANYDNMITGLISNKKRNNTVDTQFSSAMEGIGYLESKITDLIIIKGVLLYNIHYEKNDIKKKSFIDYIIKDVQSIVPFKLYYLLNSHKKPKLNNQKESHKIIEERLEHYKSEGWVIDNETAGTINLKRPKFFSIIRASGLFCLTLSVYGLGALFYLVYYFANYEEKLPFNKISFLENRGYFIQDELK